MEKAELKRCPFCNGKARTDTWPRNEDGYTAGSVDCQDCGARVKYYSAQDAEVATRRAIATWNKRV